LRRVAILIIIAVILIGSGFLSIQISRQSSSGTLPGVNVQTSNPDASVLIPTPQKGAMFIGVIVVLFVLIGGMGTGLAAVVWFVNRQVVTAKALPNQGFSLAPDTANPSGLMVMLARHRVIAIGMLVVIFLGAALTAAVLGLFSAH
jgi:hypothetical protein